MLAHVLTAYLHFLGMMILMATLLAEHVMLHTQMPPVHLQRVARTDLFYGMAAGIVFLTGLLRFAYFGKGIHFYLGNPMFYVKVGMFLLVALISIYPTVQFLSWRKMLTQGTLPELDPRTMTRLRAVIRLELGLLIVIPLLAVLMARGIGRTL
jgi:putative membrane protein